MKNLLRKYQLLFGIIIGSVAIELIFYFNGSTSIDWNMVAACAAVLTALIAIITAGIIIWQTRYTLRIQTLNQMLVSWQSSPIFPDMRKHAAATLWALRAEQAKMNNPAALIAIANQTALDLEIEGDTSHIDAILDFFEMISVYVKKDVLDFELTYQAFSWEMSCYWIFTENYICRTQKEEGDELWEEYSKLMPRFIERSKEKVTVSQATKFLLGEQSIAR